MASETGRVALVTGGAGFIGSHITDRLLSDGWQVKVVDDLSSGRMQNVNPRAQFSQIALADPGLPSLVKATTPEVVFHLAAQINVRRSVDDPVADAQCNILGSLNLLQACVAAGVGRVIFSSTGGAMYGEADILPTAEDCPPRPDSPYGIAKLAVEHYLRFFESTHEIRCVSLRYGNVYGPRQDLHGEAGVIAIFIGAMLEGRRPKIFGDGEQVRDYVHVDDVVAANLAALTCDPPHPVNIGTGTGISVNTLYATLSGIVGFGQPPEYAAPRPGEVRRSCLDSSAARRYLGWSAKIPLAAGLASTVEYFRTQAEVRLRDKLP